MNRLIKNFLIAFGLMGLFAIGSAIFAYYYIHVGEQQREEREEAERKVLALTQDDIQEITIQRKDQEPIQAVKSGDGWLLKSPLEASGDQANWDTIARSLADAKRTVLIPWNEIPNQDLSPFGLSDPPIVVTAAGIGGASQEIIAIGEKNPAQKRTGDRDGPEYGPQVYARINNSSDVITVGENLKTSVDKQLFDLRDKRVVTFETDKVRRVEVQAGELQYRLDKIGENRWQIAQPMEALADGNEISSFINRFRNGRIKQFIDEKPSDYGTYGLVDSATRIVFWFGDEDSSASWSSQTVVMGATSEVTPANVYSKLESQDNVFALELSSFGVPGNLESLRLKKVTSVNSWDVNQLSVESAGEKIIEVTKEAGDWLQVHPKQGKCTWSSVNSLVRDLVELEIDGFVTGASDESEFGLDENDIVIRLVSKSGEETLALSKPRTIEGSEYRYGVRQPPREIYQVKAEAVQKILDDISKVELEGEPAAEAEATESPDSIQAATGSDTIGPENENQPIEESVTIDSATGTVFEPATSETGTE